jgi:hypothetical protein
MVAARYGRRFVPTSAPDSRMAERPDSAPRPLGTPHLRPPFDLSSIPDPASYVLVDRRWETSLGGDLVSALLADAQKFGDLDEAQLTGQEVSRFSHAETFVMSVSF